MVEEYQPNWCPAEEDFREEWLDLGANRFFHPRGKDRKALMAALLHKTEELIAARPADLPSCKIFLFVPGGDPALAEIILIYDPDRFQTFWVRTDPRTNCGFPRKVPPCWRSLGWRAPSPGAVRAGGVSLGRLCGAAGDLGLWGAALRRFGGVYGPSVYYQPRRGEKG